LWLGTGLGRWLLLAIAGIPVVVAAAVGLLTGWALAVWAATVGAVSPALNPFGHAANEVAYRRPLRRNELRMGSRFGVAPFAVGACRDDRYHFAARIDKRTPGISRRHTAAEFHIGVEARGDDGPPVVSQLLPRS